MQTHDTKSCCECGASFEPTREWGLFCTPACRKAFNNRRMVRGAAMYDLFMCMRYQRGAAKLKNVWSLLCSIATIYRMEDKEQRAGRPSWLPPEKVFDRIK